jgi:hypothetical protein
MNKPIAAPVTPMLIENMGIDKLNANDVCHHLFDKASHILIRDGTLDSMAFLFTEKVCFAIRATDFLENSKSKDALSFLLRKAAGETEIIGIALVMEGYMRKPTEKEKRTGVIDDSRPVKEHPERKEVISVQCEWIGNQSCVLTAVFNREKDFDDVESIKIEEPKKSENPEGRFAYLFPPTRSGGYYN